MNYSKDMLYLFNSTYRNPLRPIDVTKKLQALFAEKLCLSEQLEKMVAIANEDVKLRDNSKKGQHVSFARKKTELNRLPFLTVKVNGEIVKHYEISNLNPVSQKFSNDIDTDIEYNSNVMLFVLSQQQHLSFMYNLIDKVDEKWSSIGKRKGVSQLELIYLFGYLSVHKQDNIENLSDIVINLRQQFQQKKAQSHKDKAAPVGHEKDFLKDKILADFTENIWKNGQDYIDTLMRGFALTQCFNVTRYGIDQKNVFSMKMLSLDNNFTDKISFFLKNTYAQLCSYVANNSFCNLLYGSFNVIKAYHQQNKEINDLIKTNPYTLPLQEKWETSTLPWCEYEYHCSVSYLQSLKKHDNNYDNLTKNVAVKTHLKSVYGGTTPGIADCFVVFDDIVVSVESSTLMPEYQQCNKEYIPNKTHIAKLVKEHNKTYGLCVTVMPKITKEFNKEYIRHNFSNLLNFDEEKTVLIALSTFQYAHFLKVVNTQQKTEEFINYMLSVNYQDYINENDVFYTIFEDYIDSKKQSTTFTKPEYKQSNYLNQLDNEKEHHNLWHNNVYQFLQPMYLVSENSVNYHS